MTTSQTSFLSEILGSEPIPPGKLAYFRGRLSNAIHALVLTEFMRLEKNGTITRAKLAQRIGRGPEQVTRWFGSPGNWTIETLSDLLLGMKCEPVISISALADERANDSGENVLTFPSPSNDTVKMREPPPDKWAQRV